MNGLFILLLSGVCATSPIFSLDEEETNPCQDEPNGYTLLIPGSCSDFYVCLNKRSVKQTCGMMYFNPKTHACDLPDAVDCERAQTLEGNLCDGRSNGYLIASKESCKDYFVCLEYVAIPRTCGWMHFNSDIGKCVDSRYSNCDRDKLMPKSRPVIKYLQIAGRIPVPIYLSS